MDNACNDERGIFTVIPRVVVLSLLPYLEGNHVGELVLELIWTLRAMTKGASEDARLLVLLWKGFVMEAEEVMRLFAKSIVQHSRIPCKVFYHLISRF